MSGPTAVVCSDISNKMRAVVCSDISNKMLYNYKVITLHSGNCRDDFYFIIIILIILIEQGKLYIAIVNISQGLVVQVGWYSELGFVTILRH